MIPTFLASKNRACQLEHTLRTLEKNCPGLFDVTVMYTHSDEFYRDGYSKLINSDIGRNTKWIHEVNPKDHIYDFFKINNGDIVCLMTDDCVFYRPTTIAEDDVRFALSMPDVWSFVFALGMNVTMQDYVTNKPITPPHNHEILRNNMIKWNYRLYDRWDIWGFENGFNGWVYNASDLLWLTNDGHFDRIIFYERMVCHNGRRDLHNKHYMVSPKLSELTVQQINNTHEFPMHTAFIFNKSLVELNNLYLNGYVINLDSMDFSNVNGCHQEIPFTMKRENS